MPHAEQFQTTPYDSQIVYSSGDIPDDLTSLVEQGARVARKSHPDYPRGIWFDNVRVHTIRCALTAEHLDLPKNQRYLKSALVRMLWLHDLPEIVGSLDIGFDTSAVVKEDQPAVAAKIEKDEYAVARQIFKPSDYDLFDQFERGRSLLEGKSLVPDPTILPEAYGAKIIDIGDAEMCFYHFLTAWLIHDSFDGRLPTERPYRFTMNRYTTYLTNVEKLADTLPADLVAVYRKLLIRQIRYISSRWELVEHQKPSLVPEFAKTHVAHLRGLLDDYEKSRVT